MSLPAANFEDRADLTAGGHELASENLVGPRKAELLLLRAHPPGIRRIIELLESALYAGLGKAVSPVRGPGAMQKLTGPGRQLQGRPEDFREGAQENDDTVRARRF